jgi:hypothetical protein
MDCNVFVDIDRVRIRSFALMQKNQKITATSQFAFDYAETVEKNKLAPQKSGSRQYFFLITVSSPSLKARKFRLRPKNKKTKKQKNNNLMYTGPHQSSQTIGFK